MRLETTRMFRVRAPSTEFVRRTVDALRGSEFTYSQVGWTEHSALPTGFTPNGCSSVISNGEVAFRLAIDAIRDYRMLKLGWIEQVGCAEPIAAGSMVCTLARQMGFYTLNVARIVYVDESSPNRFGFGYGTLAEYPLIGEERFTVTLDEHSGDVTYEIFSFSRPKSLVMSLARPIIRIVQRRFFRESSAAMRAACEGISGKATN
jgi:uncharacterized protein (UPF0548 family)